MSAAAVIRAMLVASADLSTSVPPGRIFLGNLPQGTPLPAISIQQIGGPTMQTLSMREAKRAALVRVQVDVSTVTPADRERIAPLVRRAIQNQRGVIAGTQVLSVLPIADGPDAEIGHPTIYSRSRDYRVTYIE